MSHTKRPRLSEPTLPNRKPQHNNQLCLQFQQKGSCDYGDRCCFAHGIAVVDESTKKAKGSGEKTKLCWRFMNGEKCVYGDKCHFIHLRCQRTRNAAAAAISVFPRRTKLCKKWMETGCCKYGPNCCFAHGESELHNQRLDDAQDYVEGGLFKLADKNMDGKGLKFKWKSNERISRVYADWINDMPLESQCI